jgi:hypothetical protein
VGGEWISSGIDARWDDVNSRDVGKTGCLPLQVSVADNQRIRRMDRPDEPSHPTAAFPFLGAEGVAVEDGVVKVKDQAPGVPPDQQQMHPGEQAALQDHHIRLPQTPPESEPRPAMVRDASDFQLVAGRLQVRLEGAQAVATTDVLGILNKPDDPHGKSS